MRNGEWQQFALCAEVDGDMFFPEKGAPVNPAKRICAQCEVAEICLQEALEEDDDIGIRGGLSAHQRKQIRWRRTG